MAFIHNSSGWGDTGKGKQASVGSSLVVLFNLALIPPFPGGIPADWAFSIHTYFSTVTDFDLCT